MKNGSKAKKVEQVKRRRQNENVADWGGIDAELLRGVVESVTKNGGAVRFGYSRDGGAYSVGIYGDGDPFTEYCGATAEVSDWLRGIQFDYE